MTQTAGREANAGTSPILVTRTGVRDPAFATGERVLLLVSLRARAALCELDYLLAAPLPHRSLSGSSYRIRQVLRRQRRIHTIRERNIPRQRTT
jgi:hypothetical protein